MCIRDRIEGIKVMLYHNFILSKYAHYSKNNVFQKIMYSVLFPVLTIILMLSGFSLLWPQALLTFISPLFGGLSMTIALASIIHWTTAATIVALAIIHACLTSIEDFPTMMIFIGLSEQQAIDPKNKSKNEGTNELAPKLRKI
jgi:thiosulfate reductase cytochrome b subunit